MALRKSLQSPASPASPASRAFRASMKRVVYAWAKNLERWAPCFGFFTFAPPSVGREHPLYSLLEQWQRDSETFSRLTLEEKLLGLAFALAALEDQ